MAGRWKTACACYRELLEETKEAVGDTMGVIPGLPSMEMMGADGLEWENEGR